jgi:hypothetical protein
MSALRSATAVAFAALLSSCVIAPPPTPQEVALVDAASQPL